MIMFENRDIAFLSTESLSGDDIFALAEGYQIAKVYLVGPNLTLFGRLRELGRTPLLVSSIEELPKDTFVHYRCPGHWAVYHADGSIESVGYAVDSMSAAVRLLSKFGRAVGKQFELRPITITPKPMPEPLAAR